MTTNKRDANSLYQEESKRQCLEPPHPGDRFASLFEQGVTPSCTMYSSSALEFLPQASMTWEELKGLKTAKKRLTEEITMPMERPEFYDMDQSFFPKSKTSNGKTSIDRVLCIYGQNGMGKASLVYSLCKEMKLTVFHVDPVRLDPHKDLRIIYEQAIKEAPSVVLLDQCEGHFAESYSPVGLLQYFLHQIETNKLPIWTIFLMHVRPERLAVDIRPSSESQIPTEMLDFGERISVFNRAVENQLYDPTEPLVLDQSLANRIYTVTQDATPRDIHEWVAKVFKSVCGKNASLIRTKEREDPVFRPTDEDFKNAIQNPVGEKSRITEFDPVVKNVMPYRSPTENTNAMMGSRNSGFFGQE